ncbi:unnamed protein product [Auanema sp. JU1783]|nr:unnamed protein product [Auanema sp. JU1783]
MTGVFLLQRHYRISTFILFMVILTSYPADTANIRLCGQRLTRTILAICRNQLCGGYVQQPVDTESSWDSPIDAIEVHRTVKRDGIATRCCMNKCTMNYLKTFCCSSEK